MLHVIIFQNIFWCSSSVSKFYKFLLVTSWNRFYLAILTGWITVWYEKTFSNDLKLMLISLKSFFSFGNSVSRIKWAIFLFNFVFSVFIANFTFVKVGIRFYRLHVFISLISFYSLIIFVLTFLSFLTIFKTLSLCVLLMRLKILFNLNGSMGDMSVLSIVRKLENVKRKIIKLQEDIKFTKTWKRENLIPTFANLKLAIKTGNTKLKRKIAHLILETELQNKHFEKRKLKQDFREINISLRSLLNVFLYNAVIHQANIAIKIQVKSISRRHQKKLIKFRNRRITPEKILEYNYMKHIVHNFSSYQLSEDEYKALLSRTIKDKQQCHWYLI